MSERLKNYIADTISDHGVLGPRGAPLAEELYEKVCGYFLPHKGRGELLEQIQQQQENILTLSNNNLDLIEEKMNFRDEMTAAGNEFLLEIRELKKENQNLKLDKSSLQGRINALEKKNHEN